MASHTPSYYRTLAQQFTLLGQIEAADGEMTQEVQDLLALNEEAVEKTTQRMLELRDLLLAQKRGSLSLIEQEQDKITQVNRTLSLIETRMLEAVRTFGPQQLGTRYVAIKTSLATDVTDASLLPAEYTRIKPAVAEQILPDGVKILSALKKGISIPGVQPKNNEKLEVK